MKKKRVSFAPDEFRANQRTPQKVLARDMVAAFTMNKLRDWKEARISEHVGKHPFSGRPGHVFYVMKSEVCFGDRTRIFSADFSL